MLFESIAKKFASGVSTLVVLSFLVLNDDVVAEEEMTDARVLKHAMATFWNAASLRLTA